MFRSCKMQLIVRLEALFKSSMFFDCEIVVVVQDLGTVLTGLHQDSTSTV